MKVTEELIRGLPAGPALDSAVFDVLRLEPAGSPSAEVAAAMRVFGALPHGVLQHVAAAPAGLRYRCSIPDPNDPAKAGQPCECIHAEGPTAMLAICRVVVLATFRLHGA